MNNTATAQELKFELTISNSEQALLIWALEELRENSTNSITRGKAKALVARLLCAERKARAEALADVRKARAEARKARKAQNN